MNPQLLRVTNRIIERSRETRSAYLARIEQAKTSTVHRSQLACGNLAHGFAACQPEDKAPHDGAQKPDAGTHEAP